MEIKLPMPVQFILNQLNDNGYEAYIVGGCVRDSIMGIAPHDWDICTSALPEQIIEVFEDYKVIPTGIQHGTVSLVLDETVYEITTYRIDGEYKDNRHPETVKFVSNLESDLARRDFTINAIAYNEEKGLVDPYNGLDDIYKKRIRCVGNPNNRFSEDALRIMRAVRFALRFNCDIELQTLAAMMNNKELLKNVSIERVCAELTKIFSRALLPFNPSTYREGNPYEKRIRLHIKTVLQLINTVVPEIKHINYRLAFYRLWYANSPDCALNLSIILDSSDTYVDKKDILRILKFSNEIINKTCNIYTYGRKIMNDLEEWAITDNDIFPSEIRVQKYYARKLLHDLDIKEIHLALEYAKVLSIYSKIPPVFCIIYFKSLEQLRRGVDVCKSNADVYDLKYLAVNGNDLIMLGFKGKQIGEILNKLLEMVMKDKIPNRRDCLIRAINDYYIGDIKNEL